MRLFPADNQYNDPDGVQNLDGTADSRSHFARGVRSGSRNIGYDLDL